MTATPFILASGSPRRRELLSSLGVDFTILKPDIDETQHAGENPFAYVRRLSMEKAEAAALRCQTDALVLAADTVVILAADTIGVQAGEILGKPADAEDARAMLQRQRARSHVVCTALTLFGLQDGVVLRQDTRLTRTTVTMRAYSDDEIERYIATGDPFDKAGSYAIQHAEFQPVAQIVGSYTNVVGLPVETLKAMLKAFDWPVVSFEAH